MNKNHELDTLANIQESECSSLSERIKQQMARTRAPFRTAITTEWGHTTYYWLWPFTSHVGLEEDGLAWMARLGSFDNDVQDSSLALVKVPMNDGVPKFPDHDFDWNIQFTIAKYGGVASHRNSWQRLQSLMESGEEISKESVTSAVSLQPDEDDLTVCRIILEDALTSLKESI